jgi:hypothetical protein
VSAEFNIDAYQQLWRIEKSFRMSKHDLRGPPGLPPQSRVDRGPPDDRVRRPSRQPLDRTPTGWTIKRFVRTTRRCRTVHIRDDLREALAKINADNAH